MSASHKITVQDVLLYCKNGRWDNFASATTADGTQRKHLDVRIGSHGYRVQRRYFEDNGEWDTIYSGTSCAEAIKYYNGLS